MKNKSYYKIAVPAATLLLGATQAGAALTAIAGDLVMGFAKVNAGGTGYAGNNYVYNLGPATNYRTNAAVAMPITNLNTDLALTFGSGWANDPTVRWGIIGVVGASDPLTAGDPARTTYFSQDYLGVNAGSDPVVFSNFQMGTLTTSLRSFVTAMNGIAENGAVNGGANYAATGFNSFSSFLPPGPSTYFGVGINPTSSLSPASESGLDVYRTLFTTTGAALNSSFDSNAVVGTGQYVGTFLLSDSGAVTFVPEPTSGLLAILACLPFLRRHRA